MANIRKIENKSGTSYKITVAHGRDSNGKQLRHYLTWTPPAKMTERQTAKELNNIAVDFEQKIIKGFDADNRQKFADYADYVLSLKEREGKKHRTLERYRELLTRINPAIGHKKIIDIRPMHLNDFYKNLGESGIRIGSERATAKVDIAAMLKEQKLTRIRLAEMAQIAPATVTTAIQGKRVNKSVADALAGVLGRGTRDLFTIEANNEPLSVKTILEHHRLISTILKQAEIEMIVEYNAATKATPPKLPQQQEIESFQPEEIKAIRAALELEPLKWRVIVHLLLITGCRRGEVAGLQWSRIDWSKNQIKIDRALLYSRTKGVYEDTTKTSTTRFIKLPIETMQLLREYKMWYTELQLKNGDRWIKSDYLFVKDDGSEMHPDSITDYLGKFAERHGLPHINPHKFRHTHASLLIAKGVDVVTVSKRLGHAKVSTTSDIYSHAIQQADEGASECIADALLRDSSAG